MRTVILFLLLSVTSLAIGQETATPAYSKIISPGEIYSTPGLCESTSDYPMLVDEVGSVIAARICPFAEEDKWPSALETFTKRDEGGREKMKDYNAWYVADLGSSVLLWIRLADNKHMPYDMRDKTDFFVNINRSAVNLGDKVTMEIDDQAEESPKAEAPSTTASASAQKTEPKPAAASPVRINLSVTGFAAQLDQIVSDYANGFNSIRGDSIPREKDFILLSKEYKSKISLEGSKSSILSEEMFSRRLSFTARYGEYNDSTTARKEFDGLVKKVDEAQISCCSFVKLDESPSDVMTTQAYIPFDLSGKMLPEYKDLMIEVSILKSFNFDANTYKMSDVWLVRISVRQI